MYFTWTEYPFKTPPELQGGQSDCQVAIVGAGPVGMAAALGLAQHGVRVVLLEARNQVSDGSRAISLDRQTMRMLGRLGVGAQFADYCIPREENLVYYGDTLVYQMKYERPDDRKHDQFNILQQCWIEQLLLDGVTANPNIDLRWLSRVKDMGEVADGVALQIDTPEGEYSLKADYVIACDGGRGESRKHFGITYESVTEENLSERTFVICDFELETDMSKARRLYLDPPYKPGATAILHAQPFNTWRLDYSLEEDEDPEEELKPERVAERLEAHLNMIGEHGRREILWVSPYRPRAVSLPTYRKGRVFFAGDAAHLSPIFGGRGVNLGFADAYNLAWKLSYVLTGKASDDLLDSYDWERRQMVKKTISDLSQAAVFMARPTKGVTLMRDAVLDLIPSEPFVRDLFDAHRAPKREGYSPTENWNDDPPQGAFPGNPLPNPELVDADGLQAFLYDLMPNEVVAICFNASGQLPPAVQDDLDRLEARLSVQRFVIAAKPGEIAAAHAFDGMGKVAEQFGASEGTIIVVRPDCYIAGRVEDFDIAALEAEVEKLLDPRVSHAQGEKTYA